MVRTMFQGAAFLAASRFSSQANAFPVANAVANGGDQLQPQPLALGAGSWPSPANGFPVNLADRAKRQVQPPCTSPSSCIQQGRENLDQLSSAVTQLASVSSPDTAALITEINNLMTGLSGYSAVIQANSAVFGNPVNTLPTFVGNAQSQLTVLLNQLDSDGETTEAEKNRIIDEIIGFGF